MRIFRVSIFKPFIFFCGLPCVVEMWIWTFSPSGKAPPPVWRVVGLNIRSSISVRPSYKIQVDYFLWDGLLSIGTDFLGTISCNLLEIKWLLSLNITLLHHSHLLGRLVDMQDSHTGTMIKERNEFHLSWSLRTTSLCFFYWLMTNHNLAARYQCLLTFLKTLMIYPNAS